ncbi:MAG: ABC transporter permease [Candidatus Omnitrophota bacterium]
MGTVDISILGLVLSLLLFVVPILLSQVYHIGLIKPLLYSTIRMSIQLGLIGIFLKYLFIWNNTILNISWLGVMILVAVFSVVQGSSMKASKVLIPAYIFLFL